MIRIKKTSQTTPTSAQIVNAYSTSVSDSYSCNYLNNNILMCGLSQGFTYSGDVTDNIIPIDTILANTGSNLTLDITNHKIKIGDNIKYILVSCGSELYSASPLTTNGYIRLRIYKNNSWLTCASIMAPITVYRPNLIITNFLIPVQKNDEITFKLFGNTSGYAPTIEASTAYFTVQGFSCPFIGRKI